MEFNPTEADMGSAKLQGLKWLCRCVSRPSLGQINKMIGKWLAARKKFPAERKKRGQSRVSQQSADWIAKFYQATLSFEGVFRRISCWLTLAALFICSALLSQHRRVVLPL